MLWRISAVLTTVLPLLSMLPIALWMQLNPTREAAAGSRAKRRILAVVAVGLCLVPYLLARLVLVVETVRTLFFLPAGALQDTWVDVLPNWG